MTAIDGLGSLTIAAWSVCVGVGIGMFLSEILHKYDEHTEADDVLEKPAVPAGSDGDDGVSGVSPGDPVMPSADREEGKYLTLSPPPHTSEARWKGL